MFLLSESLVNLFDISSVPPRSKNQKIKFRMHEWEPKVGPEAEEEGLLSEVVHEENQMSSIHLTLEDAIERVGYGRFQWWLLFITANTQLADAMELMVISFLSMDEVWCHTGWAKDKTSAISSVVFMGMLVGALFTGTWLYKMSILELRHRVAWLMPARSNIQLVH